MTPEPVTLQTILGFITNLVSSCVTWIGSFIGVITANPLVMLFVIVAFVGLGIGLLSRLMHI